MSVAVMGVFEPVVTAVGPTTDDPVKLPLTICQNSFGKLAVPALLASTSTTVVVGAVGVTVNSTKSEVYESAAVLSTPPSISYGNGWIAVSPDPPEPTRFIVAALDGMAEAANAIAAIALQPKTHLMIHSPDTYAALEYHSKEPLESMPKLTEV
jgi:hypothetical protein